MTPSVSVIVPCYKSEKYIQQCVDSILAQTFEDWEAIFIVDSPSSEMFKIAAAYMQKDARLRFEESAIKTNPAKARNRGVAMSHGKYIAFLDADDWWYSEKLSKQVHFMDTHPEIQWCWGYATMHKCQKEYTLAEIWNNPKADEMIPFQTFMLRRDLVHEIIRKDGYLLNETLPQIDDYDLYLRLKQYPNFCFRTPLSYYRIHPDGITTSSSQLELVWLQTMINARQGNIGNLPRLVWMYISLCGLHKIQKYLLPVKTRINKEIIKRQVVLQIEPTTRCNLHCIKCSRGTDTPIVDITEKTLLNILSKHHNVHTIILQGLGEPFMHPRFDDICALAKQYCKYLIVITNGTTTNYPAWNYIDHIVISMDTLDPILAKATRGNNYDIESVKAQVAVLSGKGKPTVAVNCVRSQYNFDQQADIQNFCGNLGIVCHITPIQNFYNPEEPGWLAAHEEVMAERRLSGKIDRPFQEHCPFLKGTKFYYDAMGRLHPCCIRMRYDQVFPTGGTCRTCPE